MALIVQKYGGSSVADTESIKRVAKRVVETKKKGNRVAVVVSAMGDTTDDLIDQALSIDSNPPEREMDMLMTAGERISMSLLAMAIHAAGDRAHSFTGQQAGFFTDTRYGAAHIKAVKPDRVQNALSLGDVAIVAGFQGINAKGDATTLGRGGSDTSAVALAVALGADIESTILALMTTMTASRIGRRGPVANTMWRAVTLSFTALLLATCPFIAEGFGAIPDSIIYFHVTLNLIISGTGLFIIKPFARIADRIIPEKKADAKTGGEAADLFAKENLISSGMSLNVARTELQRITGDVRSFWHDIEIMLRINPADGEILILHDRGNYINQRTSTMTRYLGLVMRGQLTTAEAIEWQYLKNANGSIKVALNTIDRIITVIMNEKCRKNRSFTPDGLKELQALHHRVGVCLEQLAVILAEKDLEKRRALCNTLNNEREAILRDSYELTLRHMERVSRGLSGAIDTSALHLELQSLFNRIVGIIGSAASMDYGTPNDPEPQG